MLMSFAQHRRDCRNVGTVQPDIESIAISVSAIPSLRTDLMDMFHVLLPLVDRIQHECYGAANAAVCYLRSV
jgi:hypothetical protein